jgi:N-methylhydantoinase B/oxoprolinase/acetone carboxylase alpha subunit
MSVNNAQTEQEFIAKQQAKRHSGQGFAPCPANGAKTKQGFTANQRARRADVGDVNASVQSESMTIRESVNLAAGMGAKALQTLSEQRDQTAEVIAEEIARLTDPTLFFAETMSRAADKIRAREDQVSFELDFFNATELVLPTPYVLPSARDIKAIGTAGYGG